VTIVLIKESIRGKATISRPSLKLFKQTNFPNTI
jgi:hypothetical protein